MTPMAIPVWRSDDWLTVHPTVPYAYAGDLLVRVVPPEEPVPPGWTVAQSSDDGGSVCYRFATGTEVLHPGSFAVTGVAGVTRIPGQDQDGSTAE